MTFDSNDITIEQLPSKRRRAAAGMDWSALYGSGYGKAHDTQGFGRLFCMLADRIEALLADKGYDADAIRAGIEAAGIEAVIPAKRNRRAPLLHDPAKYRWRNQIERLFNKPKNWRHVATRYDKAKDSYLGFVATASIKLWIPFVHET